MKDLLEIPADEPRDLGLALSIQINRCHRLLSETYHDGSSLLISALHQSVIENELRTAAIALIRNDDAEMKKSLAALKEVK